METARYGRMAAGRCVSREYGYVGCFRYALLEIIANSDRRYGLEFDSNQEATPVRGARPTVDFKFYLVLFSDDR